MQKNILIDLNVVLDVLLDRAEAEASTKILELGEQEEYRLYLSADMVTTFSYLLKSAKVPTTDILKYVHWLLEVFMIVQVDSMLLKSRIKDYEDAVVEQAAVECAATAIITRNIKDFTASTIPAFSPEIYLKY